MRDAGHRLPHQLAYVSRALPPRLKYGSPFEEARQEIGRARADKRWSLREGERRLGSLLWHAGSHSEFYRERMKTYGENLSDWPTLDRADVKKHRLEMLTRPRGEVEEISTSGSSGESLTFFLDRHRSAREWAYVTSAWAPSGYDTSQWRLVLRGIPHPRAAIEVDPVSLELRVSAGRLDAEVAASALTWARKLSVKYLHGYPSSISALAKYSLTLDPSFGDTVRGIFPISEPVSHDAWQVFGEAFPHAVSMPFYGMSEKVAFGRFVETDRDGELVYEMDPLYGFTELVDDKGRSITTPGVVGRVVSTGLLMRGMPLIRYDTGDRAELVEAADESRGHWLRMRRLTPRRTPDFLIGRDGREIPTTAMNVHGEAMHCVVAYQMQQSRPGEVFVLVVPQPGVDPEYAAGLLADAFRDACEGNVVFESKPVSVIPAGPNGKRDPLVWVGPRDRHPGISRATTG